MRNIPEYGISRGRLFEQVASEMTVSDFITAMTYLYALGRIEQKDNYIYDA